MAAALRRAASHRARDTAVVGIVRLATCHWPPRQLPIYRLAARASRASTSSPERRPREGVDQTSSSATAAARRNDNLARLSAVVRRNGEGAAALRRVRAARARPRVAELEKAYRMWKRPVPRCRAARPAPPWAATLGTGLLQSDWQWAAPSGRNAGSRDLGRQAAWRRVRYCPAAALGLATANVDPGASGKQRRRRGSGSGSSRAAGRLWAGGRDLARCATAGEPGPSPAAAEAARRRRRRAGGELHCAPMPHARRGAVHSGYVVRDTARGVFRVPPSSPPAIGQVCAPSGSACDTRNPPARASPALPG